MLCTFHVISGATTEKAIVQRDKLKNVIYIEIKIESKNMFRLSTEKENLSTNEQKKKARKKTGNKNKMAFLSTNQHVSNYIKCKWSKYII